MGKACLNLRAKWTTEDLQKAIEAVRSGITVSEASRTFNIPRRTLRDWLNKDEGKTPTRKLGRNPVLNPNIEKELKERVVRLQQVGFGVTKKILCKKAAEISTVLGIKTPFSGDQAGRYWFKGFLKRNPDIVLRKGENLSYGRLMRFNMQTVKHFFDLLASVYDQTELLPHQIYNVDETGLQLIFSGADKVLARKGSKRVHVATHGEQGETITVVACCNAVGMWIPPMVLYKGVYAKKEFGDDLPTGSTFAMTPKGYVTTEVFCSFLRHFNQYRSSGNCLLILDGHRSHMDVSVLDVAEELGIKILCLPAHCSHELQPLDKSFFKSLKVYWNEAVDSFRRQNPGRSLGKLQFPKLFSEAWYRAATPANGSSGFRATGILPYNPNVFSETSFAPSSVSERPIAEVNLPAQREKTPEKSPVQQLMATPRIERKATNRRSLNAKATVLNRELFNTDSSAASTSGLANAGKKTSIKAHSKSCNKDLYCGDCGGYFYDKRSKKDWIQCTECKTWYHETCDNGSVKKSGLCTLCEDGCAELEESD